MSSLYVFPITAAHKILIRYSQTEDVGRAHPRIVEAVETMLKKGKWTVPGVSPVLVTSIITKFTISLRVQGEVRRPQPHVINLMI